MKRDYTSVNIGNICASPSLTAINEAFGYNEKLLGGYITTFPILAEEEVSAAIRICMVRSLRIYPSERAVRNMW